MNWYIILVRCESTPKDHGREISHQHSLTARPRAASRSGTQKHSQSPTNARGDARQQCWDVRTLRRDPFCTRLRSVLPFILQHAPTLLAWLQNVKNEQSRDTSNPRIFRWTQVAPTLAPSNPAPCTVTAGSIRSAWPTRRLGGWMTAPRSRTNQDLILGITRWSGSRTPDRYLLHTPSRPLMHCVALRCFCLSRFKWTRQWFS